MTATEEQTDMPLDQDELIAAAITELYGERRKKFDPECTTCKAWKFYDAAFTAAPSEAICRNCMEPAADQRRLKVGAAMGEAISAVLAARDQQSNSVGDNKMSDADDDVPSPVWTGRLWIGQRPGEGANVTRMERVAAIWRGQGLTVTEIFATAEVAIEPLKWKPYSQLEGEIYADSPVGRYLIKPSAKGGLRLWLANDSSCDPFVTMETAKAAAQADYESRIRSALVSATASLQPNDDARLDQVLRERDEYHEAADRLAQAIANHFGIDIGEHSNINHPWINALETIEARSATASLPDGWVAVPEEPTLEWAHDMATRWQGQSETPRCEAPSDYDITLCFERIKLAIATRPPPPNQATGDSQDSTDTVSR